MEEGLANGFTVGSFKAHSWEVKKAGGSGGSVSLVAVSPRAASEFLGLQGLTELLWWEQLMQGPPLLRLGRSRWDRPGEGVGGRTRVREVPQPQREAAFPTREAWR